MFCISTNTQYHETFGSVSCVGAVYNYNDFVNCLKPMRQSKYLLSVSIDFFLLHYINIQILI